MTLTAAKLEEMRQEAARTISIGWAEMRVDPVEQLELLKLAKDGLKYRELNIAGEYD